VKMQLTTT